LQVPEQSFVLRPGLWNLTLQLGVPSLQCHLSSFMSTFRQSAANLGLSMPCVITAISGEPASVCSLHGRVGPQFQSRAIHNSSTYRHFVYFFHLMVATSSATGLGEFSPLMYIVFTLGSFLKII
jgi:hypothetical protein